MLRALKSTRNGETEVVESFESTMTTVSNPERVEMNQSAKKPQRRPSYNNTVRKLKGRSRQRKKAERLTPKQVSKLADLESYQIARSHTYKELEQIVESLTKLYAQLSQANKSSSRNDKPEEKKKLKISPKEKYSQRKKTMKRNTNFGFNAAVNGLRKASMNAAMLNNLNVKKKQAPLTSDLLTEYSAYEVEKALEKSDRAMKTHKAYKQKQRVKWEKWSQENKKRNAAALEETKKYIPENLKELNEEQLGKQLGDNIYLARRFVRHKVFLLFNMEEHELKAIHPVDLKNRYHIGGLDIIELRALYALSIGLKREWRSKLRHKLFMMTEKEKENKLSQKEVRHPAYANKPNFSEERKPSVVAFLNKRGSLISDPGETNIQRKTSILALELQQKLGPKGGRPHQRASIERRRVSKKRQPASKRQSTQRRSTQRARSESDAESIAETAYLTKREPDKPVIAGIPVSMEVGKGGRSREERREKDKKRHGRPKENIFNTFSEQVNKPLGGGEHDEPAHVGERHRYSFLEDGQEAETLKEEEVEEDEDIVPYGRPSKQGRNVNVDLDEHRYSFLEEPEKATPKAAKSLEDYFKQREEEEAEAAPVELEPEDQKEQGFKYSSNRKASVDYNDEDYEVNDNDNIDTMKRKQSELFIKAFEMINADEVEDNDELFINTLRKLSVFSETLSEAGSDEEDEFEDASSEDLDSRSDYYLTQRRQSSRSSIQARRSIVSIAESAYTEPEYLP